MALRLSPPSLSPSHKHLSTFFSSKSLFCSNPLTLRRQRLAVKQQKNTAAPTACAKLEEEKISGEREWGKVSAVLFDMDGVLCNSENLSRLAAVDVFAEMGVHVTVDDFVPFMGTGEAKFLGGVAFAKGVEGFNPEEAKKRFFEIYLEKYAKPESGIGFPGAFELVTQCKRKGLKVAVASSADRIKVDANLAAAGLPLSMFDAIVSADAFENLKPAPDIFLAASKILDVPTDECIVIEDALAGVQAAKSAKMRCIAVTTTLSEEALKAVGPALIRQEIGSVSIDDILSGGSGNGKMQEPQFTNSSAQSPAELLKDGSQSSSIQGTKTANDLTFSLQGLQGSRRDVIRYGSLGIALTCVLFIISNRKAMHYVSPKALWKMLFGVGNPSFGKIEGLTRSGRVQQFVSYISDVESRGTAPVVPEFPSQLDWLNTAPLKLNRDLKGKVVLLDFWTYCCVNCMHVLPDLEFLERKYKDMPFTVVGVHSAKFDNEKDLEAIRNAVLRYGISHPVVNDGDMFLWRELGINSWPTFAIVGPNGKLLAQLAGEGRRKDLDDLVEAALIFYGKKKMLDSKPIPLKLEKENDPRVLASPLKFPGKLASDVLNNRLFISDSNHNRIVVTDLDGNFIIQIGSSGEEGLRDGNFDDANFNRPQGIAYDPKKNLLYVADTENHALRVIDFVNETVQTVAGNGTKGSDYRGGGKGRTQLLNSPWDVSFDSAEDIVYIAMAGQHQIWVYNASNESTKAFSGDGYERNLNGQSATSTSFAQPSGISLSSDMKVAYIADSESSSIRALDLKTGGSRLLAGGDPVFSDNLFRFGDHDGVGSEVLLQHPLGVLCGKDGRIYVADSYNHKIKMLDPTSNRVHTIAGSGKAGFKDGKALMAQHLMLLKPTIIVHWIMCGNNVGTTTLNIDEFKSGGFSLSEPSGIVEGRNGRLFIADTNNSVIRYLDLGKEDSELLTLELKGVQPTTFKSRSLKRLRRRSSSDTVTVTVNGGTSNEGTMFLQISLPEGYHFSKEARSKFSIENDIENQVTIDPVDGYLSPEGSALFHYKRSSPSTSVERIYCKVYYCKEDEVCLYQSLAFEVPFQEVIPDSAPAQIMLTYLVKPKTSPEKLPLSIPG